MTVNVDKLLRSFERSKSIKPAADETGINFNRLVKILSSYGIVCNAVHAEILILHGAGVGVQEIADTVGRKESVVKWYLPGNPDEMDIIPPTDLELLKRLRARNLEFSKINYHTTYTHQYDERDFSALNQSETNIIHCKIAGMSDREIAKKYGMKLNSVMKIGSDANAKIEGNKILRQLSDIVSNMSEKTVMQNRIKKIPQKINPGDLFMFL